MEDRWTIELFGHLCARRGGQTISRFRTQKAAALLAYLALHPHRLHSREELADLLWPDAAFDSGRVNLRQALALLRRPLEPPGGCRLFQTQGYSHIGLIPGAFQTDVAVFENALRRAARASSDTERADWLNQAVQVYGGELLPGFYDDWILDERERLRENYDEAVRRLSQLEHLLPAPALSPPPSVSLSPAPKPNLPRQLTPFFGREDEVAALLTALQSPDVAVLTVTGPGGAGKTRFALEAAARLSGSRFERIAFAPLADLSDAALILPTVLDALDIPAAPDLPPSVQIAQALAETPTLLVLDNFEHLVETGAFLIADLLQRAPGLSVLITSRQPLGIAGEREFVLPPLPTPNKPEPPARLLQFPSVQLFLDRAQAIRPDFQVTPRNAETVGALCARLEGLPLALELAAGWAQTLTPAQMLAHLDQRLDLLVSRRRDLPPRHRSLRAVLESSVSLLSSEEQQLLARLTIFRGGGTGVAVEAICQEPQAPVLLSRLRERSLVSTEEASDEMRFQMLEIVREFVGELLQQNERAALERRHEDYFVALAETGERELRGAAQTAWLARLEREHDNFRAILEKRNAAPETAVRLAGALGRFWFVRGYWSEGRDWLQKSLAAASPDSDNGNGENVLPRAKALLAAGTMAWVLDEYDEAMRLAEQSLRDYRKRGDRVGMAYSLALLGRVTLLQGDNAGAADLLDESVAQFRGTADRWGLAHALDRRAFAARDAGAYEQAEALHSEGLLLRRALDDHQGIAASISSLGDVAHLRGDQERADALHGASLERFTEIGDKSGIAYALCKMGIIALERGEIGRADALHRQSLGLSWELRDKRRIAESLEQIAGVRRAQQENGAAARLLAASDALRAAIGAPLPPGEQAQFDGSVADTRSRLGEHAFSHAWAWGQTRTLAEAVAIALE